MIFTHAGSGRVPDLSPESRPEDDYRRCALTQAGGRDQLAAAPAATRWDRWIARLERRLYRNGWPARLGCAMGMPISPRVRRHAVELPDGPPADRPLRIAFASDFHAGPTTSPALLATAAPRCTTRSRISFSWAVISWGPTRPRSTP